MHDSSYQHYYSPSNYTEATERCATVGGDDENPGFPSSPYCCVTLPPSLPLFSLERCATDGTDDENPGFPSSAYQYIPLPPF